MHQALPGAKDPPYSQSCRSDPDGYWTNVERSDKDRAAEFFQIYLVLESVLCFASDPVHCTFVVMKGGRSPLMLA